MPFVSSRAQLSLAPDKEAWLRPLSQSRSESVARVQRAQILLRYSHGETVSAIAAGLDTNRPKVERCIAKALQLGVLAALLRRGRRARLSEEIRLGGQPFERIECRVQSRVHTDISYRVRSLHLFEIDLP